MFKSTVFTSPSLNGSVIFLDFLNSKKMAKTLCRVQEFYENPKLSGKVCSRSRIKNYYESAWGGNYFQMVYGCNIPGSFVREFCSLYVPLSYEKEALDEVLRLAGDKDFYLIGSADESARTPSMCAFDHELSHAFYYLSNKYKEALEPLATPSDETSQYIYNRVKLRGYHDSVAVDEVIAYLATDSVSRFMGSFNIPSRMEPRVRELHELFSSNLQLEKFNLEP